MDATGKPAAVCVTVPHRALTAPRRVASLKSRLAPTCPTRGNADWPSLPATATIGTPNELSENFPRYIVRWQAQPPRVSARGPFVGRKVGFAGSIKKEGKIRKRRALWLGLMEFLRIWTRLTMDEILSRTRSYCK
ncbi:hypothetical protein X777_03862 [Ooceraea biroi]|uniref:Uncharacterized protein n=1 Tax=Ooceraea biroi TaxID=2015173 RepID=A0A026WHU7_OOCBI|nr:hypothetical protein X777_03862 [Ooceraea biroi]